MDAFWSQALTQDFMLCVELGLFDCKALLFFSLDVVYAYTHEQGDPKVD